MEGRARQTVSVGRKTLTVPPEAVEDWWSHPSKHASAFKAPKNTLPSQLWVLMAIKEM
jgi:hypothetical protein